MASNGPNSGRATEGWMRVWNGGRGALCGALSVALASCSQHAEPAEDIGSSQQAVYGSNARVWTPETDPPFRGVGIVKLWNDDGSNAGNCSGTLVQRNLVLTAGHCF